ncbi:MAG: SGNH/GDSL hydrolase family protein [Reyranella sp.]|uniref:SGNH/GDSL hydrolase family protein n=1 Tax=Reyranella sp. TaxID=1929291 RepID=UPI003D0D57D1
MILATLVIVVASAFAAEFIARQFFDLETLQYRRPYQPVFVSGDYHYLMPNDELPFVPGGPVAMGYQPGPFGFYYSADIPPPRSAATLADYLFAHKRSRYDVAEIDRISCAGGDPVLIYVLGSSVAQGFSSEEKADTWHAALERALRRQLGRQDVHIFNGAMGGFVSLQDRLAYHLAVAPRPARLVLIVNGYNDLTLPANSGVRPGDPFQLGLRYSQLFDDGFIWWVARHSAIANSVLQNEFTARVIEFRRRLEEDDAVFARHARAITDIYMENMEDVLDACVARGQACRVAIQPARALTAHYIGTSAGDVLSQKRLVELYRSLLKKVAESRHHDLFIDLTHVFDRGERMQHYADTVHPNYAGQQVLARALLTPTLAALRSAQTVPAPANRCARLSRASDG